MREDNHSYTLLMQLRKETMPEKIKRKEIAIVQKTKDNFFQLPLILLGLFLVFHRLLRPWLLSIEMLRKFEK